MPLCRAIRITSCRKVVTDLQRRMKMRPDSGRKRAQVEVRQRHEHARPDGTSGEPMAPETNRKRTGAGDMEWPFRRSK
jgi:hypothetical protein